MAREISMQVPFHDYAEGLLYMRELLRLYEEAKRMNNRLAAISAITQVQIVSNALALMEISNDGTNANHPSGRA